MHEVTQVTKQFGTRVIKITTQQLDVLRKRADWEIKNRGFVPASVRTAWAVHEAKTK